MQFKSEKLREVREIRNRDVYVYVRFITIGTARLPLAFVPPVQSWAAAHGSQNGLSLSQKCCRSGTMRGQRMYLAVTASVGLICICGWSCSLVERTGSDRLQ